MNLLNIILLIFVLVCAVSVSLTKNLQASLLIFMGQSLAMCLIWILLRSPDLAVTEAAVGAGISSLLMFITLKKIHAVDLEKEKQNAEGTDGKEATKNGPDTK